MREFSFYGFFYGLIMRTSHRFNWHHVNVSGPYEDGACILWCHWCGMRDKYWPIEDTAKKIAQVTQARNEG